jgi:tRNA A37 methylthiotransferase MiaB
MEQQVDENCKTLRSQRLRSVLDESHAVFIDNAKQDVQTVLVENQDPVSGLASNYLRITVSKCAAMKNTWLPVKITSYDPLVGQCLAERAK